MTPSILLNQEFQKNSKLNCWPFPEFLILSSSTSLEEDKAENILQSKHRILNEMFIFLLEYTLNPFLSVCSIVSMSKQMLYKLHVQSLKLPVIMIFLKYFLHLSFYIHLLQEPFFWNFKKILIIIIALSHSLGTSEDWNHS